LLARDAAAHDTEQFRRIAKARNSLAHGDSDDLAGLPAAEAVDLPQRYLVAVAST
jgi:hypothetical protein